MSCQNGPRVNAVATALVSSLGSWPGCGQLSGLLRVTTGLSDIRKKGDFSYEVKPRLGEPGLSKAGPGSKAATALCAPAFDLALKVK